MFDLAHLNSIASVNVRLIWSAIAWGEENFLILSWLAIFYCCAHICCVVIFYNVIYFASLWCCDYSIWSAYISLRNRNHLIWAEGVSFIICKLSLDHKLALFRTWFILKCWNMTEVAVAWQNWRSRATNLRSSKARRYKVSAIRMFAKIIAKVIRSYHCSIFENQKFYAKKVVCIREMHAIFMFGMHTAYHLSYQRVRSLIRKWDVFFLW